MPSPSLKLHTLLIVVMLGGLVGCTNVYQPASAMEAGVLAQARRDVYPNDVRASLPLYHTTRIAWAAVLVSAEIHGDSPQPYVSLVMSHRYFDWIMDHGSQRQIYFLSPRGEGQFTCTWPLKKEWDLDAMRKLIQSGDMMVIYGTPQSLSGDVIDLGQAAYVREIPKAWFADDILDYGRPGQPSRMLRTALFQ